MATEETPEITKYAYFLFAFVLSLEHNFDLVGGTDEQEAFAAVLRTKELHDSWPQFGWAIQAAMVAVDRRFDSAVRGEEIVEARNALVDLVVEEYDKAIRE